MNLVILPLMVAAAHAAAPRAGPPAVAGEEGEHRDGKRESPEHVMIDTDLGIVSVFSVFQIVKFNNDACTAVDGTMGTCYTDSECTAKGGEERGKCASGFGVCCVGKLKTFRYIYRIRYTQLGF